MKYLRVLQQYERQIEERVSSRALTPDQGNSKVIRAHELYAALLRALSTRALAAIGRDFYSDGLQDANKPATSYEEVIGELKSLLREVPDGGLLPERKEWVTW